MRIETITALLDVVLRPDERQRHTNHPQILVMRIPQLPKSVPAGLLCWGLAWALWLQTPAQGAQFSFPNFKGFFDGVAAGHGIDPKAIDPSELRLGKAIDYEERSVPTAGGEFEFDVLELRESSDVFSSRTFSAKIEGRYAMFKGEASFESRVASRKTSNSIVWKLSARRNYPVRTELANVRLTPAAAAILDNPSKGYAAFVKLYGTRFISSWSRKAHVDLIFEAYDLQQQDEQHVRAMISASAQWGVGSASAKEAMESAYRSFSSTAKTRVEMRSDGIPINGYFVGMTDFTALAQIQAGLAKLLSDIDNAQGEVGEYFTTAYAEVIPNFPLEAPWPQYTEIEKAQTAFEDAYSIRQRIDDFRNGRRGRHLDDKEIAYLAAKRAECDAQLAQITRWLGRYQSDSTLKAREWVPIQLKLPELIWYAAKPFAALAAQFQMPVMPVFISGGSEAGAVRWTTTFGERRFQEASFSDSLVWPSKNNNQIIYDDPKKLEQTRDSNGSLRRWVTFWEQWRDWRSADWATHKDANVATLLDKDGNVIDYAKDRTGRFIVPVLRMGAAQEAWPGLSPEVFGRLATGAPELGSYMQIRKPIDGAIFATGEPIELDAFWDGSGNPKAKFMVDGVDVPGGALSPEPDSKPDNSIYRYVLRNVPPGNHQLDIVPAGSDHVGWKLAPVSFVVTAAVIAPTITAQPQEVTASSGSRAVFSAAATGTDSLVYSWQRDGQEIFDNARIGGSASANLTINSLEPGDAGTYALIVKNEAGSVTSSGARLNVSAPPVTITVNASPVAGGTVAGGGTYPVGSSVTVSATPKNGYTFSNWTEVGVKLPDPAVFTFSAATDRSLVANFVPDPNAAQMQIANVSGSAGATVAVPIILQKGSGKENAISFSLSFPVAQATYQSLTLGSGLAAFLVVGDSQVANGAVGVVLSMPVNQTLPAGTVQLATLTLNLAGGLASGTVIPIKFAANPTAPSVSDTLGNELNVIYVDGSITLAPPGLEGDVAPRPTGNSANTAPDVTVMGRIVAGLESNFSGPEFQRADCAPRSSLGNGSINAADLTVAARYVAGLEPKTPAGGPTGPTTSGANLVRPNTLAKRGQGVNRRIYLGNPTVAPGGPVTVDLGVSARGDENALSFSVAFDPGKLTFGTAALGAEAAAGSLVVNASQSGSGKLGFVISWPANQSMPAGTVDLLKLNFVAGSVPGIVPVIFGNDPAPKSVSDILGNELDAQFANGTVTIQTTVEVPQITVHPISTAAGPGGTVTFSVSATGGETYRWQFNGNDIPGATSAQLTVSDLTAEKIGLYTVVVANGAGPVVSSAATLGLFGDPQLYAGVTLAGPVGTRFRVEYVDKAGSADLWQTLKTVTLESSPQLVIDPASPLKPERYYRAAIVP